MVSVVDSDKLCEGVGVGGGVTVILVDSEGDRVIVFWDILGDPVSGMDTVWVCGFVGVGVTDAVGGIDRDCVTRRVLVPVTDPVMSSVADSVGTMETVREAVMVGGMEAVRVVDGVSVGSGVSVGLRVVVAVSGSVSDLVGLAVGGSDHVGVPVTGAV